MTDFQKIAERYIATWNERDAGSRRRAVDELWTEDGTYIDPLAVAEGRDAIDATIGAVQGQFPDFTFALAGPVDAHHDQARFTWTLGQPGGEPLVIGFDVAVADGDGKLRTVLGFLDKVPG
jgi:hypothetical protein